MSKNVFSILKKQVEAHLKEHFLSGNIMLFPNTQYELLSRFIAKELSNTTILSEQQKIEMGTTISTTTLKRIFKYNTYEITEMPEKRQLKTLDKLAVLIGYKNWNAFLSLHQQQNTLPTTASMQQLVIDAMKAELQTYKALPTNNTSLLEKYFIKEASAYKRIRAVLHRRSIDKWILHDDYDPSTAELTSFNIEKTTKDSIHIKTKEYWYIRWYDPKTQTCPYIYNEMNEQFYIIVPTPNGWKIKVNYYESPNEAK